MLTRSTKSMVKFANPFAVGGTGEEFPPGTYEVIVEEELLQGLSFEAYRRTAVYLMAKGRGSQAGRTTMHMTTQEDLDHAMAGDRRLSDTTKKRDAALSPREDMT